MDNLEYITKRTKSLVCPRKRNELIQSLIDDSNIDGNMRWYIENQDTLVWLYNGKHLVIVDRQVLGIFDTYEETQRWTEEKFYGEDFMIIKCEPGTRQYYIDEINSNHQNNPIVSFEIPPRVIIDFETKDKISLWNRLFRK